jgi:iron complex transport system substrate-binding protein
MSPGAQVRAALRAVSGGALLALAVALAAARGAAGEGASAGAAAPPPSRIVSLNPSLTAMLLALGAGGALVGVDDYSARQNPELAELPRVGGLHDTSLEAIVALAPDLVVLVPSLEQRDVRERLAELGIAHLALDPTSFDDVLGAIEALGRRAGREDAARARVAAIRRAREERQRESAGRPRLRGVLVLTRDPVYVVGGGSFIDEMLAIVGVENLGRTLDGSYPRASLEWLVAARPELILDAGGDAAAARSFWSRWPSLPAVRDGRVVTIPEGVATLPGPWLDRGLETLAQAIASPPTGHATDGSPGDEQGRGGDLPSDASEGAQPIPRRPWGLCARSEGAREVPTPTYRRQPTLGDDEP